MLWITCIVFSRTLPTTTFLIPDASISKPIKTQKQLSYYVATSITNSTMKLIIAVFLCFAVAMATALPFGYYGYGFDENRDGLDDRYDGNRDGKVDYGYGYGRGYPGYGFFGGYRGPFFGGYYF